MATPEHLLRMEARLEKGDALCRQATGAELDRLTAFWKKLLAEYERAYRTWKGWPLEGPIS